MASLCLLKKSPVLLSCHVSPFIFASSLIFQSFPLLESITSSVEAILYLLFLTVCVFLFLGCLSLWVGTLYMLRALVRCLLCQNVCSMIPSVRRHPSLPLLALLRTSSILSRVASAFIYVYFPLWNYLPTSL